MATYAVHIPGRAAGRPPLAGFSLNAGDDQARSLLGWWPMVMGDVRDRSVYQRGGALANGASIMSSDQGPVLNGDGSDNNISSFSYAGLSGLNDVMLSAWVYARSFQAGSPFINGIIGLNVSGIGPTLRCVSTGSISVNTHSDSAATTGAALSLNRWYHVVGGRKGNTETVWIDGLQSATATVVTTATQDGGSGRIGNDFTGRGWDGYIRDARIYARGPTATFVSSLHNQATKYALWWVPGRQVFFDVGAAAGIAFDAASNSGYQTAQASYSWSHTCTGTDRYLIVGISMLSVLGSSVTGITYNSVAMTLLGSRASVSGAIRTELWGLIAPSTGSNTIAVTLSAALDSAGGASSFTGVHQTSPVEGFNSATATNVGAADATVDVTTVADNDWVIDNVATDDTAITVGAGQTQRTNVTGTLGSGALSTEGPKTPAGSVTMSWTDVAALATWSIGAVALRPIAAADLFPATFPFFQSMLPPPRKDRMIASGRVS